MTQQESLVRDVLEMIAHQQSAHLTPMGAQWLLDHLGQPRMPEHLDGNAIKAFYDTWNSAPADGYDPVGQLGVAWTALREHFMKPRTNTVEVWHVDFSAVRNGKWVPFVNGGYTKRSAADLRASELRNSPLGGEIEPFGYRCIKVTGPYFQEVPT